MLNHKPSTTLTTALIKAVDLATPARRKFQSTALEAILLYEDDILQSRARKLLQQESAKSDLAKLLNKLRGARLNGNSGFVLFLVRFGALCFQPSQVRHAQANDSLVQEILSLIESTLGFCEFDATLIQNLTSEEIEAGADWFYQWCTNTDPRELFQKLRPALKNCNQTNLHHIFEMEGTSRLNFLIGGSRELCKSERKEIRTKALSAICKCSKHKLEMAKSILHDQGKFRPSSSDSKVEVRVED